MVALEPVYRMTSTERRAIAYMASAVYYIIVGLSVTVVTLCAPNVVESFSADVSLWFVAESTILIVVYIVVSVVANGIIAELIRHDNDPLHVPLQRALVSYYAGWLEMYPDRLARGYVLRVILTWCGPLVLGIPTFIVWSISTTAFFPLHAAVQLCATGASVVVMFGMWRVRLTLVEFYKRFDGQVNRRVVAIAFT